MLLHHSSRGEDIEERRHVKLSPAQKIAAQALIKTTKAKKVHLMLETKRDTEEDCLDTLSTGSSQDPAKNCALFSRFCSTKGGVGDRVRAGCRSTCELC